MSAETMRNWIALGVVVVVLLVGEVVLNEGKILRSMQHAIQETLTSIV